ncbi:G-protein coupled receptor Mth2-like isoform X2 [Macrobrachium nipponense]|uniref:G-protein coupled receptor Mth2-like isoform X2 n=1 Tax=Macrobrachium nipponense TaxID=159736 RepID=UPI0030C8A26A
MSLLLSLICASFLVLPMASLVEPAEVDPFEDCQATPCVSKCCPQGTILNITQCVEPADKNDLWEPTFYDESAKPLKVPPAGVKFKHGFPVCEKFVLTPHLNPEDEFFLLEDGYLNVPLYQNAYAPGRYCVEKASVSLVEVEEVALLCFPDKDESPSEESSRACKVAKEYVYPVLLMVSCVFLTITLFVYVWIPELRGKLHGRCLLSMVSSLLATYVLMTVVMLAVEGMSDPACLACAFLKQLTMLASFFWLNVMCFDIWRSLKSMRPASETSAKSRQRFLLYSAYAWGSPLLIASVTMVVQTLDPSHRNLVRPNFLNNRQMCWFEGTKPLWLYVYMFILTLTSLDIAFFLMVAYILLKSRNNQRLQRARSQNRDRLWLCGKIFLVMGITWITEVISWQQGTCEAWILTDIINALQGFTIFLVFVCKKSTRQMVTRRVSKMKSNFSTSSSTKSSKRSSTFFTSLSQSGTRNTTSSVVSHSAESQSLTGASAEGQKQPNKPMTIIREADYTAEELTIETRADDPSPGADEDCPSIPEERSDQELDDMTPKSPPGDSSESPMIEASKHESRLESRGESGVSETDELVTSREEPDLTSECSKAERPEENSPLLARNKDT